jgi:hypothetical protein
VLRLFKMVNRRRAGRSRSTTPASALTFQPVEREPSDFTARVSGRLESRVTVAELGAVTARARLRAGDGGEHRAALFGARAVLGARRLDLSLRFSRGAFTIRALAGSFIAVVSCSAAKRTTSEKRWAGARNTHVFAKDPGAMRIPSEYRCLPAQVLATMRHPVPRCLGHGQVRRLSGRRICRTRATIRSFSRCATLWRSTGAARSTCHHLGGLDADTRPAVHAQASFDLDATDDPPGSLRRSTRSGSQAITRTSEAICADRQRAGEQLTPLDDREGA